MLNHNYFKKETKDITNLDIFSDSNACPLSYFYDIVATFIF